MLYEVITYYLASNKLPDPAAFYADREAGSAHIHSYSESFWEWARSRHRALLV